MTEVQAKVGKTSGDLEANISECPLCLHSLQCPRSLPCYHAFCEECLKTSILGQSQEEPSFTCPVCREVTLPIDPNQNRDEWATMFVANKLTIEIKSENGSGCKRYNCYPCSKQGKVDSIATVLWKETNKYLCDSCKKNDLISEDVTLLSIEDDFPPTTEICSQHSAVVDVVCDDHHSVCCPKCIAIDHRRCDAVHN
ncbi:E3 ubiquitin-protein ligase TRIM68-like [Ylistrum balloti]|uniref:E3 ubiquitin-protein ligase TRIM68-like n=1 Tax=Ylistrum balloti TaxID=509963 RepID=UPI002905C2E3|nr:E3 ubiquitin-protein ligase TRIM68-like [Ylistrum balloti]